MHAQQNPLGFTIINNLQKILLFLNKNQMTWFSLNVGSLAFFGSW